MVGVASAAEQDRVMLYRGRLRGGRGKVLQLGLKGAEKGRQRLACNDCSIVLVDALEDGEECPWSIQGNEVDVIVLLQTVSQS